jgi:hypothetical protein
VIEDDDDDMPEYGDESAEVTDEMIDQASDKRNAGMDAMAEGTKGFFFSCLVCFLFERRRCCK